jgi:uncharacterized protein (DUF2141 family)
MLRKLPALLAAAFLAASTVSSPALGLEPAPAGKGSLTVEITGLRNGKGQVWILVFDQHQPKAFPGKRDKALGTAAVPIVGGKARVVFEDLPHGAYAVSVVHDENLNYKVDTNFIGIPKEGVGLSRRPKRLGMPSFDEAKVMLDSERLELEIPIFYFI